MRIEKEVVIKDRKSLKMLEKHLTHRRDELRMQTIAKINLAKEKWSPVHLAEDFLHKTAVPYVVHTVFGIARSLGKVKENTEQDEWIELIESLAQAFVQKKAAEFLHDKSD